MKRTTLFVLLVLTVGLGWSSTTRDDYYRSTRDNIDLFSEVYLNIIRDYVDVVDPEPFVQSAISAMVDQLDPYTTFFDEKDTERLRSTSRGKYGGIGMQVGIQGKNEEITVIAPMDGTPAARAGLAPGDVIVRVDTVSLKDMSLDEAVNLMRGDPGTPISLTIRRSGISELLEFHLKRAEILLKDVKLAQLLPESISGDHQIGYVKLGGFSANAPGDLEKAVRGLLAEHDLDAFVLDLRSNPGGLLKSAVGVADLFLEKGKPIVSTRGREGKVLHEFNSEHVPVLPPDLPMAVLINNGSASASEIVTGALQDHDRALVAGQTSFGKGLVQSVVNLDNGKSLKITTARYYIPSGRLIQRIDYFHGNDVLNHDLTAMNVGQDTLFHTSNQRQVISGKGIIPDLELEPRRTSRYTTEVWRQGMFFDFVNTLDDSGQDLSLITEVGSLLPDFRRFLEESEMEYRPAGMNLLDSLESTFSTEEYSNRVTEQLQKLKSALLSEGAGEFDTHQDELVQLLTLEIASRTGGTEGRQRAALDYDRVLKETLAHLLDGEYYASTLNLNNQSQE